LIPKISKELSNTTGSSAATTENSIYPTVVQASYVNVFKRVIFVVCTTKGIFVSDRKKIQNIFFKNLKEKKFSFMKKMAKL
jgi:hypothetical protein